MSPTRVTCHISICPSPLPAVR